MKQNILFVLLMTAILGIVWTCSGCAVGMALSGKRDRDITQVRTGMQRNDVIFHLGADNLRETLTNNDGTIDMFEIQKGNAPSAGRAVGHAVLDLLTWGLWEVIGTPLEAATSELIKVKVNYDKNETVTKITAH